MHRNYQYSQRNISMAFGFGQKIQNGPECPETHLLWNFFIRLSQLCLCYCLCGTHTCIFTLTKFVYIILLVDSVEFCFRLTFGKQYQWFKHNKHTWVWELWTAAFSSSFGQGTQLANIFLCCSSNVGCCCTDKRSSQLKELKYSVKYDVPMMTFACWLITAVINKLADGRLIIMKQPEHFPEMCETHSMNKLTLNTVVYKLSNTSSKFYRSFGKYMVIERTISRSHPCYFSSMFYPRFSSS